MTWLAALIADIVEILVQKLGLDITTYFKQKADQKAVVDAAQASVVPLEKAKTGKEVSDAAPGAFDGT